MKIRAYYPNYFTDYGICHACYHLLKGMQVDGHDIKLKGIASEAFSEAGFYSDIFPKWSKSIVYKLLSNDNVMRVAESSFVNSLQKDVDIAYLWPAVSVNAYKKIKNSGYKIIYEGVNTHEAYSKAILDAEYSNLKLPSAHEITAAKVINESTKIALADYVYSCSPIMTVSMLTNGVPQSKILQTSYGLSSSAILNIPYRFDKINKQPTFIFVGSISVRKGVHLLLKYWAKANLNAKLKLVGTIEDALKPLVSSYLSDTRIEHIPFTSDLPSIYTAADVFILPSLEEGSPLVTYLALGASLPVIVSPMGGGGIITDAEDGFVIEPHDESKWVESMRQLAESDDLRHKLSKNSKQKATHYVWDAVGKRRLSALIEAESLSI